MEGMESAVASKMLAEVIEGDETHVKRVRLHAPEDGWDDEE